MVENNKIQSPDKQAVSNKKDNKKITVQEVVNESKKGNYIDTSAPVVDFKDREQIEKEVSMVKVGRDPSGRWLWRRSDRLTAEDKKRRADMVEAIRRGKQV